MINKYTCCICDRKEVFYLEALVIDRTHAYSFPATNHQLCRFCFGSIITGKKEHPYADWINNDDYIIGLAFRSIKEPPTTDYLLLLDLFKKDKNFRYNLKQDFKRSVVEGEKFANGKRD